MAKTLINTKAVVIREVTVGEADKLLTLLTPELGRITARCRGVRTLKSRRFAAAQQFIYSDMVLSEKDGLYALEEADAIESFFGIRTRLEAIACAEYFAELVNTVTVEGEGDADIMSLFLNGLYMLTREDAEVLRTKAVFEARLVMLMGIMPDLSACSECGKPSPKAWLDAAGGVILCDECALNQNSLGEGEKTLLPLDKGVAELFSYVAFCEGKRIFAFAAEKALLEEFSRVTERYLHYQLGKKFETLSFLHSVL